MSNAGDQGAYFIYTGQDRYHIPRDVIPVRVHPSIRVIKDNAFEGCRQLTIADLGKGVEEIGVRAFCGCTSLREIVIPPAIRVIGGGAFAGCSELTIVVLGKGLEEIGVNAFTWCTSLREIVIPPAVRKIKDWAFSRCSEF
jgi:hypothetical protein